MMKRSFSILLSMIVLLTCSIGLTSCDGSQNNGVFMEGESTLTLISTKHNRALPIILRRGATETDVYAAERLQYYLCALTGIHVPILYTDGEQGIYIGAAVGDRIDTASLKDETYTIAVKDGNLCIAGQGSRGTIYGVYAFLKQFCNCRWFSPDAIQLPKTDLISVPDDTFITSTQYFEYRETDWDAPKDPEYSIAHSINANGYRQLPSYKGGTVGYVSRFCHTLTTQFCNAERFAENPELFALHDGKRTPDQLCLTNEETFNIVLDEVIALLEEKPATEGARRIVSITQNDNRNYCQCEKCKAIDDANGSQAGTNITFANKIAQAMKDKGYDDVLIDTFAYTYTRKTPTKVKPLENVIVRLCSVECCFLHPLDDPNCEKNVQFIADLASWSEICQRLYIWDYTVNYSYTCTTFSNFKTLQRNVQIFREYGARGVYEQGCYFANNCNGEFADLRAYLITELLANPYVDYQNAYNEFLEGYYGKAAAKCIDTYLNTMYERQLATGCMTIYEDVRKMYATITDEDIANIDELWEKAVAETADERQRNRVERSRISWEYWKAANCKGQYSRDQEDENVWKNANIVLYNSMNRFGLTTLSEVFPVMTSDINVIRDNDPTQWATQRQK